ncbi:class I SAM-dependent methyltransferase [bacterium]|jgi:2-polyprenyl-3-methyl-5-hydroxy-6-metoxy-1,4-benzoquinol methylase|nr:class I SAM-dependent methyltransferase [bacterium]
MIQKRTNESLKGKYNKIFDNGAYKNYFTFNSYSIFKAILSTASWEDKNVLDIGCGEGDLSAMLSFAGAKKVDGIDYSKEAISLANEKLKIKNVNFIVEDAHTVSGRYDVIVMAGVLEHMDKPFDLVDKLVNENLNKGGKIVTASPSFLNPRGYVWMALQILLDVPMSLSDIHFFMPSDFKSYASSRNLKVSMESIDHDWGGGRRTILDFKKRLVNALKDRELNNSNVPEFLKWFEEAINHFNHDNDSGAIMVTSIYK